MMGRTTAATNAVNEQIKTIREQSKLTKQKSLVSLLTFADGVTVEFADVDVSQVSNFSGYAPNGNTSLNDAIMQATNLQIPAAARTGDLSNLVVLVTDGEENHSRTTTREVRDRIAALTATDRWTFVFMVPPGKKNSVMNDYGLFDGNVREWELTDAGLAAASKGTSSGTMSYFSGRSLGMTSSKSFYTDLTNVTAKQVSQAAMDISRDVRSYTVKVGEIQIRDFVEKVIGTTYAKGKYFYQLMKEEKKVQPTKKIVVKDNVTGKFFGGSGARALLGLPNTTVRVVPKNHGNFTIFVQSTSVNRKLPRGTQVLYVP
jgi:hypothetical protein